MVMVKPLSNAELEIMHLLWKEGVPLTAHQILERMPEKSWKVETLLTFLSRLQRKGAVGATKVPTAGRRAHSLFSAAISQSEYCQMQNHILIEKYHGGSVESMIQSLLDDGTVTPAVLESIAKKNQ